MNIGKAKSISELVAEIDKYEKLHNLFRRIDIKRVDYCDLRVGTRGGTGDESIELPPHLILTLRKQIESEFYGLIEMLDKM